MFKTAQEGTQSKPVPMIWKGIIQENMLWLVASLWVAFPPNPNASSEYSSAITKIISQATRPWTWMAEHSQIQWVLKEFPFGNDSFSIFFWWIDHYSFLHKPLSSKEGGKVCRSGPRFLLGKWTSQIRYRWYLNTLFICPIRTDLFCQSILTR